MSIANPSTEYSYFRGRVAIFNRNATTGAVESGIYVGNCPELKMAITKETIEHYESMSGLNRKDRTIVKTVGVDLNVTLENIEKTIAQVLVWGTPATVAAATNRTQTLHSGILVNDLVLLDRVGLTGVDSIIDSAGSPATLVAGTDYDVDLNFGIVKFKNLGSYVQPFIVQFDSAAYTSVPVMSATQPIRYIVFEGTNKGNPGQTQRRRFEFYYCPVEPVSELSLMGDDLGKFELKASCLVDDTRESDSALGAFGRIAYVNG